MKKFLCVLLALVMALSLVACGNDEPQPELTELPEDTVQVSPMEVQMDLNNLTDATLAAAFGKDDLITKEEGLYLTVEVFSEVLYDAVEVSMLREGNILISGDGTAITVESVAEEDGAKLINGGLELGGLTLVSGDGGTFTLQGENDIHQMQSLGSVILPVDAECVITDSADPANPEAVISPDTFGAFLESDTASFNAYNTVITVDGGAISAIKRNYMP